MTFVTPDSYGSPVQEFNPCHSPTDGKFCVSGQGRMLGVAARRAARADDSRLDRARWGARVEKDIADSLSIYYRAGNKPNSLNGAFRDREESRERYRRRQNMKDLALARSEAKGLPVPAYMRADAIAAWKADRAHVLYDPHEEPTATPGSAHQDSRHAWVQPSTKNKAFHTKPEQLSTLRHELGHIDRTPLGRGANQILGRQYSPRYIEEIRAWKNAIRNSGGRVDFNTVRAGLRSYMKLEDPGYKAIRAGGSAGVADQHVALLKRYAMKIRKASRKAA